MGTPSESIKIEHPELTVTTETHAIAQYVQPAASRPSFDLLQQPTQPPRNGNGSGDVQTKNGKAGGGKLYRRDLIKNFPRSFSYSSLMTHFAAEYERIVGNPAPKPLLRNLVYSFAALWDKTRNKRFFLMETPVRPCQAWLDKPVPTGADHPEVVLEPFQTLTDSGKKERVQSLLKREPEVEELEWLLEMAKQKRQLIDS